MKKSEIPFEKAMEKLEALVSQLEAGDLSLEKSLDSFETGMKLAKTCEEALNQASGRVEKIMNDFGGKGKLPKEKIVPYTEDADGDDNAL